jgi:excisionase family DNA binding protein
MDADPHAPFQYQANPNPLKNPKLSRTRIDEFVRESVKNPDIIECCVDWNSMCFAISFASVNSENEEDIDHEYFAPYEVRNEFKSSSGEIREGWEPLVIQVESVWAKMAQRFRSAVRKGHCRVFARCDQPHARQFTQISADAFELFKVIDWKNGIAKSDAQESKAQNLLYSLHVAPPLASSHSLTGIIPNAAADKERPLEQVVENVVPNKAKQEDATQALNITNATEPKAYTVKEAANLAKMGRSTLYNEIREGRLIARKSGRHTLILKKNLSAFLNDLPLMNARIVRTPKS